jgi:hypothetical protein
VKGEAGRVTLTHAPFHLIKKKDKKREGQRTEGKRASNVSVHFLGLGRPGVCIEYNAQQ